MNQHYYCYYYLVKHTRENTIGDKIIEQHEL